MSQRAAAHPKSPAATWMRCSVRRAACGHRVRLTTDPFLQARMIGILWSPRARSFRAQQGAVPASLDRTTSSFPHGRFKLSNARQRAPSEPRLNFAIRRPATALPVELTVNDPLIPPNRTTLDDLDEALQRRHPHTGQGSGRRSRRETAPAGCSNRAANLDDSCGCRVG